jgi:hypothetical protein
MQSHVTSRQGQPCRCDIAEATSLEDAAGHPIGTSGMPFRGLTLATPNLGRDLPFCSSQALVPDLQSFQDIRTVRLQNNDAIQTGIDEVK